MVEESDAHRGTASHEEADASTKPIVLTGIALGGLVGIGLLIAWLLAPSPAVRWSVGVRPLGQRTGELPPEPRLETHADRARHPGEAVHAARLRAYGWVDREAGIAHIPIERAMAQIASRGLPDFDERGATTPAPGRTRESGGGSVP